MPEDLFVYIMKKLGQLFQNCHCKINGNTRRKDRVFKSNHPKVFSKKDVLKNFTNFTRKYLCQSHFLFLFKKNLRHKYLPANYTKCFRTAFLWNTCKQLVLRTVKLVVTRKGFGFCSF